MSLCGSIEQTKVIEIHARDNKERIGPHVTAVMHLGQERVELDVHKSEDLPYTYEFHWSENGLGVAILEVYFDGEQVLFLSMDIKLW